MLNRVCSAVTYVLSFLLVFTTLEVVARECQFIQPPVFDCALGRDIYPPGSTIRHTREGQGTSHWGNDGIRQAPCPTDGPTILVLGDSYTEALQVNDDETYACLLNQSLAKARVLNAGFTGSSVADYLALATNYKQVFRPQLVVVQVRDDDFIEAFQLQTQEKGYFRLKLKGQQKLEWLPDRLPEGAPSALRTWVGRSAALNLTFRNLRESLAQEKHSGLFGKASELIEREQELPDEPETFACINSLIAAYEGKIVFLYLPPYKLAAELEPTFVEKSLVAARVPMANMREVYQDFRVRGDSPYGFPNFRFNVGHLNPSGHKAVAELLSKTIRNAGFDH